MIWLPRFEVYESEFEQANFDVWDGWTLSIHWGFWTLSFTFSRAPKGEE
jgi:hypothetical protein